MEIDLSCSHTPRVSVIIVATSKLNLLRACLRSVARAAPSEIPFETIIVLNEAGRNMETDLRAMVSGVQVESASINLGFAGAANRGRASAHGELLLLLHDDTEVDPGWMEALVQTVDSHPEAGAVGGKVLHSDGRLQNAGMIMWRDGYSSPPWVGEAPPPVAFDQLRAVDYCGSSSLMVRAAGWDAVGGLDERLYPVYYVDVDLCMALRSLGFVVYYQPASRIRHHQGASSNLHFRRFAAERNRLLFIEKWGKALEQHEPRMQQSLAAIERAMARAEAFTAQCCRKDPSAFAAPARRPLFDPRAQEQQAVERDCMFYKAYVGHLTQAFGQTERELAELHVRLADYYLGEEIDFSDPIRSRHFLAGEWGETEAWGVWTIGRHAALRLPLKTASSERLILKALVQPFLTREHPHISVSVSSTGRQVAEWQFALSDPNDTQPRWCKAIIPARTRDDLQQITISFAMDSPASPLALGLSDDDRMLGLGLRKMRLMHYGQHRVRERKR